MRLKYWRFSKCPHEWEAVSRYFDGFDNRAILFCPHCRCFRKMNDNKAQALLNAQSSLKRHGYTD